MLNWWLGRPVDGAERVPGADPENEPPETPAPIFAARALKSAFFGTPGIPQDDTLYGIEEQKDSKSERERRASRALAASPTKPPGILMTPGTATTRRKTVSFGSEVVDNEGKVPVNKVMGRPATPKAKNSPWTATSSELSQPTKKTALTRSLEDSRLPDSNTKKRNQYSTSHSILPSFKPNLEAQTRSEDPQKVAKPQLSKEKGSAATENQDITVDLNEPRSQSGRYWKAEFQRYHDEALAEMRQLVRYKQLAKSYARKKDEEALDLAEKLKEEQAKMSMMENNITELMLQIAADGKNNGDASPEMMRDLARQTALAFQYRLQVEEFRKALEGDGNHLALPKATSKSAEDDTSDDSSLRLLLAKTQQALATAERTAEKYREEKNKLSQDLLQANSRFDKLRESSEKRLKLTEDKIHKKDERIQTLQKDYDEAKKLAKDNRRDAEQLLRKRHDQIVSLRKEIASLKASDSTIGDLRQTLESKSIEHNRIVEGYKKQIAQLQANVVPIMPNPHTIAKDDDCIDLMKSLSRPYDIARPSKTAASTNPSHVPTYVDFAPRPSQPVLSEITNYAKPEPNISQKLDRAGFTPLAKRFQDLTIDSPMTELHGNDPSLPLLQARTSHERYVASPPSTKFDMPSSPPKAAFSRPRLSEQKYSPAKARHNASAIMNGSRCALPPDRVAAARARLAQKSAQKKRARALGLENLR